MLESMKTLQGLSPLILVGSLLAGEPGMTPLQRQQNLDSFEQVWSTVRDRHWDPSLGGLNWQAVHDTLRPRVEAAKTPDEARKVITELLAKLNQSHFAVVPAQVYQDLQGKGGTKGGGYPGLELRILEGRALVTGIEKDSPAARQGVMTGWEILRIAGEPVGPRLTRLGQRFLASTQFQLIASRALLESLSGEVGTAIDVEFHDGRQARSLKLERAQPRGSLTTFGNMPATRFWLDTLEPAPGVACVRFNIFLNPMAVTTAVEKALQERSPKGFIIDLRGNPGGLGGMAMGLAGWFTSASGQRLGTMHLRGSALNFVVFPRPDAFAGPLAILVDGCSASTSEIFAEGMKDLKRARIFGTRTAGAALPSMFERLPNGDGFQYAIANYTSEGGQPLEGLGVLPDEVVSPAQSELLAGKDPVMDRAVAWINQTLKEQP